MSQLGGSHFSWLSLSRHLTWLITFCECDASWDNSDREDRKTSYADSYTDSYTDKDWRKHPSLFSMCWRRKIPFTPVPPSYPLQILHHYILGCRMLWENLPKRTFRMNIKEEAPLVEALFHVDFLWDRRRVQQTRRRLQIPNNVDAMLEAMLPLSTLFPPSVMFLSFSVLDYDFDLDSFILSVNREEWDFEKEEEVRWYEKVKWKG